MEEKMKDCDLILASGSPRRRELLTVAGISFEVIVSECDEECGQSDPALLVTELSRRKALQVSSLPEVAARDIPVLAADTVVSVDGRVLGKPADDEDAFRMLRTLSGRSHEVYTGVCLLKGGRELLSFSECTQVEVFPLSDEEIRAYIRSGEPMDKAGSYGIQGSFMVHVKGIRGDYNNVVGFPVAAFYQECKRIGIKFGAMKKGIAEEV